jgi:glycolate oxidase subunit GlcD
MTDTEEGLLAALRELLGPPGVLTGQAALSVYARDASHLTWGRPLAVALPDREADVARIVALCAAAGVTVVARGAGTGLSGGAVPPPGALVLGTARLVDLGPVDAAVPAVRAQPGVLNAALTRHAAPHGLHFAPDPSSQAASTIGGNIAENAGGPHCLRMGVTSHHLRSLDWCDAQGRVWTTGEPVAVTRGLDLRGLLCGSEGTLGLVTGAWLQLTPEPGGVETLLAEFPRLDEATSAVAVLLRAGLLPVAVEIIDRPMVLTVEEAFAFGLSTDVEAVMIVELAGAAGAVAAQAEAATEVLRRSGARAVRRARDSEERAVLWQCRKRAFGAVGRFSPNYVSMDVVVPLGQLSGLVCEIQQVRVDFDVKIATAFHAGDGNLHPAVHYDARCEGDAERAQAAADVIIRAALRRGGSVTGEHGVGLEKTHALPWQLDAVTAGLLCAIKDTFDPRGLLNPGKALPSAGAPDHPGSFAPLPSPPSGPVFAWDSLTVSAPASATLAELQEQALSRGLWLPLGLPGSAAGWGLGAGLTSGRSVDRLLTGPSLLARATARDLLLEVWATTGDGRPFHAGAPVFKNVAGYDLVRLICGADGRLADLQAVTLQLRPAPAEAWGWRLEARDAAHPDDVAAGALFEALRTGGDGLAGSQAIIERGPAGDWRSAVLLSAGPAAGTFAVDLQGRLQAWASTAGLRVVAAERWPFARAAELSSPLGVPAWALAADTWTALQPRPGRGAGALPPGAGRLIWQDAPRLVWTPDAVASSASWLADQVVAARVEQPLPSPAANVPLQLLRSLKRCFDPGLTLGGPSWLTGGADG